MCCTLNLSLYMILQSLDFDVYLNFTIFNPGKNNEGNHVILLVKSVETDGDIYLLEGGAGHPVFQAIRLDFGEESHVYHESYLRYKFVKVGEKIRLLIDRSILYLSHDSSSRLPKSGEFMPFYDFVIQPTKDIEIIRMRMNGIYLDPVNTPFHNSIRAIQFINKKMVLISNNKLALESDDGIINLTVLADDEAIVAAFNVYFPELGESCIRKAVQNLRNATVS